MSNLHVDAPSPEETALLVGLRRAEPWAVAELHTRLFHVVRRTLGRLVTSSADREDLAQIALERVMSTVADGGFTRARNLSSWASGVAQHVAQEHHRASRREGRLRSDYEHAAAVASSTQALDVERSLFARWELQRLTETLSRMRHRDARVLLLHHGLGYSLSETAAAMGASEVATQTRLTRARRELLRRAGPRDKV
jgi:RNA polymerase sigma factor (sigma-70 family)